jgi:hypothetical protein
MLLLTRKTIKLDICFSIQIGRARTASHDLDQFRHRGLMTAVSRLPPCLGDVTFGCVSGANARKLKALSQHPRFVVDVSQSGRLQKPTSWLPQWHQAFRARRVDRRSWSAPRTRYRLSKRSDRAESPGGISLGVVSRTGDRPDDAFAMGH